MDIIFYKRSFTVLVTVSVLGVNCRKSDGPRPIQYSQGLVLEDKSNKPIPGAAISLQKCTKYSVDWGCIKFADKLTTSTDSNGIYQFDNSLNVARISVSHPNYWSWTFDYAPSPLYMIPYAFVRLRLKKHHNAFSSQAKIQIGVGNPANVDFFSVNFFNNLLPLTINYLPQGSVVYLTGFGNNENDIYWNITDGNITSSNQFPQLTIKALYSAA